MARIAKILKEIRCRVRVEPGSAEEILLEFLQDGSQTPYSKKEMLMIAVKMCWLPLAYKYANKPDTEVWENFQDMEYRWQIHYQYLRDKLGVPVDRATLTTSHSNSIADVKITEAEQERETEIVQSSFESFNPFGHGIVSQ